MWRGRGSVILMWMSTELWRSFFVIMEKTSVSLQPPCFDSIVWVDQVSRAKSAASNVTV